MNIAEVNSSYGQFSPYQFPMHFDTGSELSDRDSTRVNLVANNTLKNKY